MNLWTDYCCYAGSACDSALVTHTRRLEGVILVVVACLNLLNEWTRHSSARQAITPARYDAGTLATKHNAETGERGYHNTTPPWMDVYIYVYRFIENSSRNQTRPENSENGSKMWRFTLTLPHLPLTCKAEADYTCTHHVPRTRYDTRYSFLPRQLPDRGGAPACGFPNTC